MTYKTSPRHSAIEPLESRIAPASVVAAGDFSTTATFGAPIALHAGQGLSTAGANSGTYLLYVEKGDALVFLTDLNNNGNVDFNEITGIAAGDGLRLTSFVDIHGDIVTNLLKTTANVGGTATSVLTLSDSDNNGNNDPFNKIGDGRVLENSTIEKIELRSLTTDDLTDQNQDGVVDDIDVGLRKANTTYSIFGNIYAGKGFGVAGGGLIVNTAGGTAGTVGSDGDFGFAGQTQASVGAIHVGTSASNQFFSFGVSNGDDISGTLVKFTPAKGQAGGDIISVHAATPAMKFNISGLYAGDGGIGARGGNIQDVTLTHDDTGGYEIVAGNGGRGPSGGAGGSILNFADLGSTTSKVTIESGNGGDGATGVGGSGGNVSFSTFNVFGNVNLQLGSGGDGLRAGGNGASLVGGTLSQAARTVFVAGNAAGTMHESTYDPANPANNDAEIGTHQGVDFDGDGFGDFVYTSKTTNQLVVQLGDGTGAFKTTTSPDGLVSPLRYYLSGARNAEALTIGDFNGDGHPDIAVASDDQGSQAGIVVFLSKYEDLNNDGTVTSDENVIQVPGGPVVNDFLGFYEARYSVLPQLDRGDPTVDYGFGAGLLPSWQSPHQVSALTSGDFDGDGKTELAAVVTFYAIKTTDATTGATTQLSQPFQTILFLTPDQEFNNASGVTELTGQFYADFGTVKQTTNGANTPAAPKAPFFVLPLSGNAGSSDRTKVVIEASALTSTATHDVLFAGVRDAKSVRVLDYSSRANAVPPAVLGTYSLGQVDTDRDLSVPATATAPATNHVNLVDVTLEDFTVTDYNGDGSADLFAISSAPQGFMVGVRGDGTGAGVQTSGGPLTTGPAMQQNDNAGNYFFTDKGLGFLTNNKLFSIKSFDLGNDGSVDDFVVLVGSEFFEGLHYQEGPQPTGAPAAATTGAVKIFTTPPGTHPVTNGPEFFSGVYLPTAADQSNPFFATNDFAVLGGIPNVIDYYSTTGLFTITDIGDTGFGITVGDGGNSIVGKGGVGGNLGGGSKFSTVTDPVTGIKTTTASASLTFALDTSLDSRGFQLVNDVKLVAGNGGDGFSSGGAGGSVTGVSIRGNQGALLNADFEGITATLVAGSGGRGVSAAGGAGGNLSRNTVQGGAILLAGDGGDGRTGGDGGDILGNGSSLLDASNINMTVIAGFGGNGDKRGGAGGNILNFHPFVGDPGDDIANSFLDYEAGDGGTAVSGPGGKGGSITNSSPLPGDGIQSEILVQAGAGGRGLSGGIGGAISKFSITPAANSLRPEEISFLGGRGGDGTSGAGGAGGSVSDVSVPTRGVSGIPTLTNFGYSRVLAGDGGISSGNKGGKGGDVSNIQSGATNGSFALVAGAGGNGLTFGGDGGNVLGSNLFLASSAATKALIVAGIGGDATSFVANMNDGTPNQAHNAFGGRPGTGGDGGSISGFTQTGSIGSHFDLIAGNGGNTINFGSIKDITPYVGTGGSISHVKLLGDVGNVALDDPNTAANENIPIKSYNDILSGETMAAWINNNVRTSPGGIAQLDDNTGNVGIVVGAAGRNKAVVITPGANPADPASYKTQPAQNAINGSLIDIEARNIMSAVAGNVDLLASIQVARDIRVLKFVLGSDKGVIGQPDYLDRDGNPTPDGKPQLDGRLVDGALIAKTVQDASGKTITLPGRVYNL